MSLPSRPWTEEQIRRKYRKYSQTMTRAIYSSDPRLLKRADALFQRITRLWFQCRSLNPHAPAGLGIHDLLNMGGPDEGQRLQSRADDR